MARQKPYDAPWIKTLTPDQKALLEEWKALTKGVSTYTVTLALNKASRGIDWRGCTKTHMAEAFAGVAGVHAECDRDAFRTELARLKAKLRAPKAPKNPPPKEPEPQENDFVFFISKTTRERLVGVIAASEKGDFTIVTPHVTPNGIDICRRWLVPKKLCQLVARGGVVSRFEEESVLSKRRCGSQ